MNEQTLERLAQSLTGESAEILPFLPYLLQDLWELGSSPEEMLRLLETCLPIRKDDRVLDLGCGKGAVSVRLAAALGCRCKGVDLMADFIWYAREKAEEYGVGGRCEFAVGDIARAVTEERNYDLVIYGAVGNVLDSREETLKALAGTVRPGGHVLLDDAYLEEDGAEELRFSGEYPTLTRWRDLFRKAGLTLAAIHTAQGENPGHERDFLCIRRRAEELAAAYPSRRALFERYVQSQQNEYADLEERLVGAVFLLRKA